MRRVVLLGLSAVLAIVIGLGVNARHQPSSHADAPPAAAVTTPAAPSTVADASPTTVVPSTGLGPAGRPEQRLAGGSLARAWLTAYLSRATRSDEAWAEAIAPLSTPDLVSDLRSAGPELVGLEGFGSWRVTGVRRYEPVEPSLDTESRQMLAYAADVTDGVHTAEKPFVLYAYRQDDGRLLVGMIDQPYSSEG